MCLGLLDPHPDPLFYFYVSGSFHQQAKHEEKPWFQLFREYITEARHCPNNSHNSSCCMFYVNTIKRRSCTSARYKIVCSTFKTEGHLIKSKLHKINFLVLFQTRWHHYSIERNADCTGSWTNCEPRTNTLCIQNSPDTVWQRHTGTIYIVYSVR